MPNFKKYNYDQSTMVVINFEEQLQPNTFGFTLHRLIDNSIDLAVFYDKYKVQGQWQLFGLVHNVEKLMRYSTLGYQ